MSPEGFQCFLFPHPGTRPMNAGRFSPPPAVHVKGLQPSPANALVILTQWTTSRNRELQSQTKISSQTFRLLFFSIPLSSVGHMCTYLREILTILLHLCSCSPGASQNFFCSKAHIPSSTNPQCIVLLQVLLHCQPCTVKEVQVRVLTTPLGPGL